MAEPADIKTILHTKAEVTKSEEDGVVEAVVASTSVLDRQGDVIEQDGWDLKNFKKNPVILWGHNVMEERPPIGRAEKVWIEGAGKSAKLMFKAKFDMADAFAAEIYRKVKDGFLSMVSVGFLPIDWEKMKGEEDNFFGGNRFTKQELLEVSFVPVPANPQAAVQIRSMKLNGHGVEPIEEDKLFDQKELPTEEVPEEKVEIKEEKVLDKGVIPFKATETAPESEVWDGPGEVAKAQVEDLKVMCAWFDSDNPDMKSSYKLPHHKAGDHVVVWRGVASAMALLLGAKGGVAIPEENREAVYNHLAKHYAQFDKPAPEFRHVQEQTLKGLDHEIGALALDHEDRYAVKLIKKVIDQNKEQKRETNTLKNVVLALKVVDKAVETALSTKEGGGKK